MFVLFSYDVKSERTHVFLKMARKYLGHEQFSVFFGDLSATELEKMRQEIRRLVVPGDRIFECVAANRNNIDVNVWRKEAPTGTPSLVVDARHKKDTVVL